jgi:FKBP-type peptidyl-prolyl cis-trans isomerase FklB
MRVILTILVAAVPAFASAQGTAAQAKPTQAAGAQAPATQTKPTEAAPAAATSPAIDKNKLSYALGMDMGTQFKARSVEIDPALFAKGLQDVLSGAKTAMTPDEAKAVISELQKIMAVKLAAEAKVAADKNKAEGEAFLAANKAKDGVVTLPSGVQYKIITAGTGKKPLATETVVCQYRGTLIDGTEFDSSYKRNAPATFGVGQVIKGWTEVLQLMPVGSKWQVFIPSALAYGERGAPPAGIGPNTMLIFEIELVSIK